MIEKLVLLALEKGWGAIERGSDAAKLRLAIRARLARELRFNLELMKSLDNESDCLPFIENCRFDALNQICSLTTPLSLFFSEPGRSIKLNEYLKATAADNRKYAQWTKDIESEVDLVERIWHRASILKVRLSNGHSLGDLGYLRHLMQALFQSLA